MVNLGTEMRHLSTFGTFIGDIIQINYLKRISRITITSGIEAQLRYNKPAYYDSDLWTEWYHRGDYTEWDLLKLMARSHHWKIEVIEGPDQTTFTQCVQIDFKELGKYIIIRDIITVVARIQQYWDDMKKRGIRDKDGNDKK